MSFLTSLCNMAPPTRPRYSRIPKEKFSVYFGPLKSQPYNESASGRGAASHHRYVKGMHDLTYCQYVWKWVTSLPLVAHSLCLSLRSIAWNPLGTLVATGASDKTLRVCESLNARWTRLSNGLAVLVSGRSTLTDWANREP